MGNAAGRRGALRVRNAAFHRFKGYADNSAAVAESPLWGADIDQPLLPISISEYTP